MTSILEKISPPTDLRDAEKNAFFKQFFCRLAAYRNNAALYAVLETSLSQVDDDEVVIRFQVEFEKEITSWGQSLLDKAWVICYGEDKADGCPKLDPFADTAIAHLKPLPPQDRLVRIVNAVLFVDITDSKTYSAHTRTFLSSFTSLDEDSIIAALKNPDLAIEEAQKLTEKVRSEHADRSKALRVVGVGLGAVAGGVLVGVTGGLAAPLVGAGVSSVFAFLGLGGSIIGLLAGGLASSAVVCGALFGTYGAKTSLEMVGRHMREVSDLAILPVGEKEKEYDSLGVKLCVSGWLQNRGDVIAPWTSFTGDNVFALQWEIEALEELSNALMTLVKSEGMKYVKSEVLKRTFVAGLMQSLAPLALLKVGQIMDNPWMNARALAIKTGAVLGDLLANRVFGNRPVTLVGYSFGSLVIFEALKWLALLPPSKTTHLVENAFLFGTPAPASPHHWTSVRRLVSGRLVNGYSNKDYVLAILSRTSDATWDIAGLQEVAVKGVENILCEDVEGHTEWRWVIEKYLQD